MDLLGVMDSSDDEQYVGNRVKVYKPRVNFAFESDFEFKERFRMSSEKVEALLQEVGHVLQTDRRGGGLTPKQQLSIALHWFGSGGQYHTVADMHGTAKATVCRTVKKVVTTINNVMFENVVRWPENVDATINGFYQMASFPHVIGTIDGILIPIDAPIENEAAYVDRHSDHSLNCMFVCGPDLVFYYVSSRWPGSVHDARVLRNSNLHQALEANANTIFPNGVLLGDSGYPLKRWLMTPLHHDPANAGERRYNRRLKATRQTIERALGVLKEKFPCLNHLRVRPTFAAEIIKTCCTLCNFARRGDEEVQNVAAVDPEGDEMQDYEEIAEVEPSAADAAMRQLEIINSMA